MSRAQSSPPARARLDAVPLRAGALTGAVAFVLGYVLTYAMKIQDVSSALSNPLVDLSGVTPPADWQVVGWYLFRLHTVPSKLTVTVGGTTRSQAIGLDAATWMLLVPVAILLVGGYVVARYVDAATPVGGATAGASLAVAYVVLALLLSLVTAWSVTRSGGTVGISPDLVPAVLVAGVVYPVLFGGVGGAVAGALGNRA
jgi:hypothetical protein